MNVWMGLSGLFHLGVIIEMRGPSLCQLETKGVLGPFETFLVSNGILLLEFT